MEFTVIAIKTIEKANFCKLALLCQFLTVIAMPSLIDKFTWTILTHLHNEGGSRYKDMRNETNLSDSVVASRLDLLRSYNLVKVTPVVGEDESFFEYKLTPKGVELVEQLKLDDFMKRLKRIVPNFK